MLRPGTFSLSIAPVIAAVLAAFAIIALDGAAHAQAVTATSPGTRPVLTAEQKAQLTSQIAAGQRASRRAGSYARRGKTHQAEAEWQAAALAYAAALQQSGDVQLRLPLAIAEEGRGQLVAAAEQLRALARAPGVRPDVAAAGAARLTALHGRLARISFTATPERTVLYRGIEVLGTTPLPAQLLFLPGTYTFRLEADGYRSKEVTVELAAGDDLTRAVDLFPLAPLMPPIDRPAPPPVPRVSRLLPLGLAATTALVLAGGGTGAMALHRHRQFEGEDSLARRRHFADSGERWALATDVLLGAALLTAAGTTYYYFAVDAPRRRRPAASATAAPPRPRLVPWATADSAGIGVAGAL